jgi:hypothetical protein
MPINLRTIHSHNFGQLLDEPEPKLAEVIESIIVDCGDPARVLELYYWSREPGVLEVIRSVMALPPRTRALLEGFLAVAQPDLVSGELDEAGRVTLSSPDVTDAAVVLRRSLADQEPPRRFS